MATSRGTANAKIREACLQKVADYLRAQGEDVLQVKSNEIAFPCLNELGNEEWIVLTLKVPNGSRDGEPYDGYGEAESYRMKVDADAKKAQEAKEAKEKKIQRDQAMRAKKAELKKE